MSGAIKRCINCGIDLPLDARFCDSCGTSQAEVVESLTDRDAQRVTEERVERPTYATTAVPKRSRLISVTSIACFAIGSGALFFTIWGTIIFGIESLVAELTTRFPRSIVSFLFTNILLFVPGYLLRKSSKFGVVLGIGLSALALTLFSMTVLPSVLEAPGNIPFVAYSVYALGSLPDVVALLLCIATIRKFAFR